MSEASVTPEADTVAAEAAGGGEGLRQRHRLSWPVFWTLMGASFLGSLVVIPYSWVLAKQMLPPSPLVPMEVVLGIAFAVQTVLELGFSALAIWLGLRLGEPLGLGAPLVRGWLAGDPEARRRLRAMLPLAVGLGLATGVVIVVLSITAHGWMPKPPKPITVPGPVAGFFGAIGAGIREELWLRLGLMTLFVWAGARLARQEKPGPPVVWVANLLATLAFGAMHLPQAQGLFGGHLPGSAIAYVLLLNGLGGLVFGWLYWRRGLLAAMVAHFSCDVVLHVIAPMLPIGR